MELRRHAGIVGVTREKKNISRDEMLNCDLFQIGLCLVALSIYVSYSY